MRFPKLHFSASSLRLTVLVSCGTVLLLLVSLGALSWFAHQALKDEAMHNAQQMLSGTVQQVDNILVNVEQSTDFVYQDLLSATACLPTAAALWRAALTSRVVPLPSNPTSILIASCS